MIGMWRVRGLGASAPRRVEPGHLRQLHVHQDQIGQLLLRQRDAGLAVDRLDQPVGGAPSSCRTILRLYSLSST